MPVLLVVWLLIVGALVGCTSAAPLTPSPVSSPTPGPTQVFPTVPLEEIVINPEPPRSPLFNINTLVYELPGWDEVEVINIIYAMRGNRKLTLDLYYPPGTPQDAELPVVVFGLGYPMSKLRLRNSHFYTSWARAVAAAGMIGVSYDTEQPDEDLAVLVDFIRAHAGELRLDPGKIGFMSTSGNTATVMSYLMQPGRGGYAFSVYYYGLTLTPDRAYMEKYGDSPCYSDYCLFSELADVSFVDVEMPVMIVKVGQDFVPYTNEAQDYFAAYLNEEGAEVSVIFYEEGVHGFDTEQQTEESAAVIAQTIEFMLAGFAEK